MFSATVEELVGLSDAELTARIEANELERRRLDAEMSAALAVGRARDLHAAHGHRTMAAFCRARLNWSTTEASRRLGVARAVNDLDGFGDAWTDGRFGWSQSTKLSITHANPRIRAELAAFAPQLLEHAEQLPYRDFAVVVDHFVAQADADGAHDDRDAEIEGRRARVVGVGGTLDVRASGGDGLTAAEMVQIHARFTEIEFRNDVEANRARHGELADGFSLPRTDRQRRYDALVAIFRAAATVGDVGRAAEPLVNIAIDSATWGRMILAAGLSTSNDLDGIPIDPFTGLPVDDTTHLLDDVSGPARGRMCETTDGTPLHPHDVLRAALAGHVRRVVVDSERVVIDLGRRQRLFTGSARQAAKLLLRRCEHAGCELPADWCDVDHADEWDRDHGRTDQSNAAVLCRTHNNAKYRHRWRTRRARNGSSYTIRADGTVVLPVGARAPEFAHPADHDDGAEDPREVAHLAALARRRIDELVRERTLQHTVRPRR